MNVRIKAFLSVAVFLCFANTASALHIIPDQLGDPHFISGPCPQIVPPD